MECTNQYVSVKRATMSESATADEYVLNGTSEDAAGDSAAAKERLQGMSNGRISGTASASSAAISLEK